MSDAGRTEAEDEQPSAAMTAAITRFQRHHPGNACVDCLTVVYQAGVLDAAEALQAAVGAQGEAQ